MRPYLASFGVFLGAAISTSSGRLLDLGASTLREAHGLSAHLALWLATLTGFATSAAAVFAIYLADRWGARRVLLAAGAIFTLTSLLSPLATSWPLVFTLQVAGALAAGMFYPLTLSFVLRTLPEQRSIDATAVYSVEIISVLALSVPLLGLYLYHLSWRWLYWHGAALAPAMMLCVAAAIPADAGRGDGPPSTRWRGVTCVALAAAWLHGALVIVQRAEGSAWQAMLVASLGAAGLVLIAIRDARHDQIGAFLDRAIANRWSLVVWLALFGQRFVLLAVSVVIPTYLLESRGDGIDVVAGVVVWLAAPQLVTGVLASQWVRRRDARVTFALGLSVAATACLLGSGLDPSWRPSDLRWLLVVLSAGLSLSFVSFVGLAVARAKMIAEHEPPRIALAFAAGLHLVRLLGGQLGVTTMVLFVRARADHHLAHRTGASADRDAIAAACADGFLVIALVCLVVILMLPLLPRSRFPRDDVEVAAVPSR